MSRTLQRAFAIVIQYMVRDSRFLLLELFDVREGGPLKLVTELLCKIQ